MPSRLLFVGDSIYQCNFYRKCSGRSRGGARGARPPLIFSPSWGPKGRNRKKIFWRPAPPPYLMVLKTPPPAPYLKVWIWQFNAALASRRGGGGGVLPYIILLYGYVPPNGVVILKLLIWNVVSITEVFSRTGYNISNARKLQFCKQLFEITQGQIAFEKYGSMRSQANCCTLVAPCVLACRAGVFWCEPRALTPPCWINRRAGAEVSNESIMYPREMETGSKEF